MITSRQDPHVIHVPGDVPTLSAAITIANNSRGKSFGTIHTVVLGEGVHTIDSYINVYGYELNYVEITVPLFIHGHPDQINHRTIVEGGFLLKGRKNDPSIKGRENIVSFYQLTISNSADCGIYCFRGLGCSVKDVLIEDCDGRGMVVQETFARFSGIIQRCGMSGLCARDGGKIIVSCTEYNCTCPLKKHPGRTRIESNCINGYSGDFGIEVEGICSQIHIHSPLTKESITSRNAGGGNCGGTGTITTVAAELQDDTVIHVPEESQTIAAAIKRAKDSMGHIQKIVLKYGRHQIKGKYIVIDFSPLEIIGAGDDKTYVEGGGFKITGEKRSSMKGSMKYPILIKNLCVSKAGASGFFAENGIPLKIEDCTVVDSSAYGICSQLTLVEVVETVVENSGLSGMFAAYGGQISVVGPRSRVWGNCMRGRGFDYGLRMHGKNSIVSVVSPLTKISVSTGNMGGGNYGTT